MPIPGRPNPNTRSQRAATASQRRSQGTAQSQAWTPEQSGQAQSTAQGIFARMRSGQGTPQQGSQMSRQQRTGQPGPGNTTVRQANAMSRERRTGQTGALGMLSERLSQGLAKKKKTAGQQNAMARQGLSSRMMAQRQQVQSGRGSQPGQQGRGYGHAGGVEGTIGGYGGYQGGGGPGGGGAGGMGRFTEPFNPQGRQVGGGFEQPLTVRPGSRRRGPMQE